MELIKPFLYCPDNINIPDNGNRLCDNLYANSKHSKKKMLKRAILLFLLFNVFWLRQYISLPSPSLYSSPHFSLLKERERE